MTLIQSMNLIAASHLKGQPWLRSFAPTHPNPWPDGVCVEWVRGKGWVPCEDVDVSELLAEFHGPQIARVSDHNGAPTFRVFL